MTRYLSSWRCCGPFALLAVVLCGFHPGTLFGQWFDNYKNYTQINAKLTEWATTRPDLVTPLTIGTSIEGRQIRGIRLKGPGGSGGSRPSVLLNGVQHAREWVAAMTPMYIADQLITRYDTDFTVRNLMDDLDIVILPVLNPDGYEYSWTTDRFWRKNRRNNGNGTFGVDLNRNWGFGWGLSSGSSGNPTSEIYRGPSPFSEPETQAIRDFYLANQNIVTNIDFHSYSQLILYPWGYTNTQSPPDAALLQLIGTQMQSAIFGVHGQPYDVGQASTTLYLASGVSIDWTYGDQGVYSYTVELRPQGFDPGFNLPPSQIIPTGQENYAGVLALLSATSRLARGDFNLDNVYNCSDVNALSLAIRNGTNKAEFDLNRDGLVNSADLGRWLINAGAAQLPGGGAYLAGDANLDGVVNAADFNILRTHLYTNGTVYCTGDFNGDGRTDGSDFSLWNQHKSPPTVPEPVEFLSLIVWASVATSARALVRRRTRQ